jgi:cAMP phosphodiesterase
MVSKYFTLYFDETINDKSKKELQVSVRFWSTIQNKIIFNHLETFFIEKRDGDTLLKYLKID